LTVLPKRQQTRSPRVSTEAVGRERNVRRQTATDEEMASRSFSPQGRRGPSSLQPVSPQVSQIAGSRLHQSATEAQRRRAAAQRGADEIAITMASPRSFSPQGRRGPSSPQPVSPQVSQIAGSRLHQSATEAQRRRAAAQRAADEIAITMASPRLRSPRRSESVSSWESYDAAELAYEEEDCVAALLNAQRANARRRSGDEEFEKELRRQRFWATIAEEERKLATSRLKEPASRELEPAPAPEPEPESELAPQPEPKLEPSVELDCSEVRATTLLHDEDDGDSSSDCGSFMSC
jgi:hypothetical protein